MPTSTSACLRCRGRELLFQRTVVTRFADCCAERRSDCCGCRRIAWGHQRRRVCPACYGAMAAWDHDYAPGHRTRLRWQRSGARAAIVLEASSRELPEWARERVRQWDGDRHKAGDGKVVAAFRMCLSPVRIRRPCAGPVSEHASFAKDPEEEQDGEDWRETTGSRAIRLLQDVAARR